MLCMQEEDTETYPGRRLQRIVAPARAALPLAHHAQLLLQRALRCRVVPARGREARPSAQCRRHTCLCTIP